MWLLKTRPGVVGVYTFYGRRRAAVRYKPVIIEDYARLHWATPAKGLSIMQGMCDATMQLARQR